MPTIADIRNQYPQYADVPDRELVRGLHKKFYEDVPYGEFLKKIDFNERIDPTKDMGQLERFNAGAGKAFYDLGQGAAQLVGMGESGQETKDRRALDRPLMNTAAGVAGNVGGNVAAFAPAMMMAGPAGATVPGAAALSAIAGGMQPAENTQERLGTMGKDFVLGGAIQAAAGPGARYLGERAAEKEAALRLQQKQNAVRDETLAAGQQVGYVTSPSAINPSATNKILESIAGKAATGQQAAITNQSVTNNLARESLGMPPSQALSEGGLEAYRGAAAQPYRDIAGLSGSAQVALEQLKDARFNANNYAKFYQRSGDPEALAAAKNLGAKADALEKQLEGFAAKAGKPELIEALHGARTQIAKSYDVERALNVGTGDVSARLLGNSLDRGKPLSGGLETAGRFAQAFPSYARDAAGIQPPGVSKSAALAAALLGGGGAAAAGPVGLAAGALPLASGPVRSLILSKPYQRLMAQPNYSPGMLTQEQALLADPEMREKLAALARAVSTPAAMSYQQGSQ